MTLDKGIRTLIPGVVLPDEEKEMAEARAAIKAKLTQLPAAKLDSEDMNFLQAASRPVIKELPATRDQHGFTPSENLEIEKYLTRPGRVLGNNINDRRTKLPPINIDLNLPKETKNEYGYTPSQEKEIEKQMVKDTSKSKGAWKRFVDENNRVDQKKKLFNLHKLGIQNSSKKWEPPKKLDGFKGTLIVDPKHPDGIKLTNEHDMYDLYKDDPVRYVEEVRYLYRDGDPPKDRIKQFDGHDSSTFPYNQKKELDNYQKKFDNLTPQQKKQLEWNQKKAEVLRKRSSIAQQRFKTKG